MRDPRREDSIVLIRDPKAKVRERDRQEIAKVCERDHPEIVEINACDSAFGHIGPHEGAGKSLPSKPGEDSDPKVRPLRPARTNGLAMHRRKGPLPTRALGQRPLRGGIVVTA